MKTLRPSGSFGLIVIVLVPILLLTGCQKYAMLLIPGRDNKGRPPIIRSYRGDYVIIPRPLRVSKQPLTGQQLRDLLNKQLPHPLYRLRIYENGAMKEEISNYVATESKPDTGGPQPDGSAKTALCLPNKAWDAIDKAAKEEGATQTAGELQGGIGVSCNNSNITDQQAAEFAAKLDALLKTQGGD